MGLISLAAILEVVDQKWPKKIFGWCIVGFLVASFIIQIIAFNYNKTEEQDKENRATQKFNSLSAKYDSATKVIIKQGDTIRLKEDGIRGFIEAYLLKDSIMRAEYDSLNKIDRGKDHPELVIFNPKLYRVKEKYSAGYWLENQGQRTATKILFTEYIVSSIGGIYQGLGDITLSTSGNLTKGMGIKLFSLHKIELTADHFHYPTYYYIEGTYEDNEFKSKKYSFRELFCTVSDAYKDDSSVLTVCRPWEDAKIRSYLHR